MEPKNGGLETWKVNFFWFHVGFWESKRCPLRVLKGEQISKEVSPWCKPGGSHMHWSHCKGKRSQKSLKRPRRRCNPRYRWMKPQGPTILGILTKKVYLRKMSEVLNSMTCVSKSHCGMTPSAKTTRGQRDGALKDGTGTGRTVAGPDLWGRSEVWCAFIPMILGHCGPILLGKSESLIGGWPEDPGVRRSDTWIRESIVQSGGVPVEPWIGHVSYVTMSMNECCHRNADGKKGSTRLYLRIQT